MVRKIIMEVVWCSVDTLSRRVLDLQSKRRWKVISFELCTLPGRLKNKRISFIFYLFYSFLWSKLFVNIVWWISVLFNIGNKHYYCWKPHTKSILLFIKLCKCECQWGKMMILSKRNYYICNKLQCDFCKC